jgi:hypothetical protein
VAHSSVIARRFVTVGVAALVMGTVLLGTAIAASARTTPSAAAVAPQKKKHPATTSTTSTTAVPPSTTTQPCSPTSTTATGVNTSVTPNTTATLTMNPGTCIVSGTVVSLSGSGFTAVYQGGDDSGTFLECNSDPNQPTVSFLSAANQVPVGCTEPTETTQGPGVVTVNPDGTLGPDSFKILEGAVGPPCGSCTGISAKDTSGGSPFTDATAYPCPPTQAQQAAGDTCGILFGDEANDGVTVPISFNTLVPPAPVTTPTAPPSKTTATVAPAAKAKSTTAGSGSLAFTGSGPGLWWLALLGLVLMTGGAFALALVDQPRRLLRVAVGRVSRSRRRSP